MNSILFNPEFNTDAKFNRYYNSPRNKPLFEQTMDKMRELVEELPLSEDDEYALSNTFFEQILHMPSEYIWDRRNVRPWMFAVGRYINIALSGLRGLEAKYDTPLKGANAALDTIKWR